jgi:hypothetical protein
MYRSLEKIYSQQVRGNVAPRRHLRVLGEAVEEETAPDINSLKAEIHQAIDGLKLQDIKETQYLLNQIYNFPTYKNIKKSLSGKGYSPKIFKKFSNDVQQLLVSIPKEQRDHFIEYLNRPEAQINFPTTQIDEMNIFDIIGDGLDRDLVASIMKHTGQDEGGRGVGMGELALALIFKDLSAGGQQRKGRVAEAEKALKAAKTANQQLKKGEGRLLLTKNKVGDPGVKERIEVANKAAEKAGTEPEYTDLDAAHVALSNAKQEKAKGDLEINGVEFEIKGEGATLGERPDKISNKHKGHTVASLAEMGKVANVEFRESGDGYQVGEDWVDGLNNFPIAISKAYEMIGPNPGKQKEFEDKFKAFLKESGELTTTDTSYRQLQSKGLFDLSNPASIQNGIGLLNFIEYAEDEGFGHFMAHDFGTKGDNDGRYVFVSGNPLQMALGLLKSANNPGKGVRFEKVNRHNLRPRIGFGNSYAGMTPTSVNVQQPVQETEEIDEVEDEEIEYYYG